MSTDINHDFVFQADSELVNSVYTDSDNFLIEFSAATEQNNEKFCAIYFSSNNLYYPNKAEVFDEYIVKGNRYEWYGTRFKKASKHIFIRDVFKQWYIKGINSKINNPDKILEFLREVTQGYKVLMVGSSSGGFAAVLFGQLLNAETIYTFNGQFEVNSLLEKSLKSVDPILFRNRNKPALRAYYDLKNFIKNPESVYYFRSIKSEWDVEQYNHIKDLEINTFNFETGHHGIPFAKTALPKLLNMNLQELDRFKYEDQHPLVFSYKVSGFKATFKATLSVLGKMLKI